MGFLSKLKEQLEYKVALKQSILEATDAYLFASLSLSLYNIEQKEAFSKYTFLMDKSEEFWNAHKKLIRRVYTSKTASIAAKRDAIGLAKIYEEAAKRLAFVANSISIIGKFQPTRSMEMIADSTEYPVIENETTQRPIL